MYFLPLGSQEKDEDLGYIYIYTMLPEHEWNFPTWIHVQV